MDRSDTVIFVLSAINYTGYINGLSDPGDYPKNKQQKQLLAQLCKTSSSFYEGHNFLFQAFLPQ